MNFILEQNLINSGISPLYEKMEHALFVLVQTRVVLAKLRPRTVFVGKENEMDLLIE